MKKTTLALAFLVLLSLFSVSDLIAHTDQETFTIYLIRHSEKDLVSENPSDPPLTKCGIKRTDYLRSFFEDIDIESVYSTNYIRTKNTAMPIASLKKTRIQYYESDYPKVFSEFLLDSKQNSLVVGHSNTIPILAGLLSEEDVAPIDEKTYNRIYKIVISKGKRKLFMLKAIFNCK
jgi:broad specificity phosphatase PhoE|tara:strand:- start:508 stop:1035 length:528 start_codon:yes stop_codon:yes gene_type:complete